MKYLLTIDNHHFVLPPGTKIELLLKALAESVPVLRYYDVKKPDGDYRDRYKFTEPCEIKIETVADDQFVAIRKDKDGNDVPIESSVIVTPDPRNRRRIKGPQLLLSGK